MQILNKRGRWCTESQHEGFVFDRLWNISGKKAVQNTKTNSCTATLLGGTKIEECGTSKITAPKIAFYPLTPE